ncbi:MAG: hypothetical protein EOR57_31640 [Mesorhizobium sp.]|nr:MAG: hypothetical protein EOR57_31640 [Mesorhizobium sp.]
MVKILTLAVLLAISGCQTTKGSFCAIAKPVRLSEAQVLQLSDAEVKALLAHNQRGQRLCGWKP